MKIPISGLRIGHWTNTAARTGCTVMLFPEGTVASGEVRGGAPATREFDLLAPERAVQRLDALVLSGGSVFGLSAAEGVVSHLADAGLGFPTGGGPVPIVVGLALYDLLEGDGSVRPGAADGRAAAEGAMPTIDVGVSTGSVGAGTGATVGTWRGRDHARPGGVGVGVIVHGGLTVAAVVAVNAAGDVGDSTTSASVADGIFGGWPEPHDPFADSAAGGLGFRSNTTIGAVITDAALNKGECLLMAQSAHDGLARAVFPPHMRSDGDAFVAAATGSAGGGAIVLSEAPDLDVLRVLAVAAVERAVVQAC